jgi:hypothetical protein
LIHRGLWSGRWESNPRPKLGRLLNVNGFPSLGHANSRLELGFLTARYTHSRTELPKLPILALLRRRKWLQHRALCDLIPRSQRGGCSQRGGREVETKRTPLLFNCLILPLYDCSFTVPKPYVIVGSRFTSSEKQIPRNCRNH